MREPDVLPTGSGGSSAWWGPQEPPGRPSSRDRRGRPLVATVHDLAFRHYPEAYPAAGRRYHERSARIVADEAARGLVPSEATARDLAELYGVDRGRVTITPLGVEVPPDPDHAGAGRLLADLGVVYANAAPDQQRSAVELQWAYCALSERRSILPVPSRGRGSSASRSLSSIPTMPPSGWRRLR